MLVMLNIFSMFVRTSLNSFIGRANLSLLSYMKPLLLMTTFCRYLGVNWHFLPPQKFHHHFHLLIFRRLHLLVCLFFFHWNLTIAFYSLPVVTFWCDLWVHNLEYAIFHCWLVYNIFHLLKKLLYFYPRKVESVISS